MIKSFKDEQTQKIFEGFRVKTLDYNIQKTALKKMIMIHAAKQEKDLRIPPGNHFERLQGDRLGQCSIRINDKYRLCFRLEGIDCYDVEICDYH